MAEQNRGGHRRGRARGRGVVLDNNEPRQRDLRDIELEDSRRRIQDLERQLAEAKLVVRSEEVPESDYIPDDEEGKDVSPFGYVQRRTQQNPFPNIGMKIEIPELDDFSFYLYSTKDSIFIENNDTRKGLYDAAPIYDEYDDDYVITFGGDARLIPNPNPKMIMETQDQLQAGNQTELLAWALDGQDQTENTSMTIEELEGGLSQWENQVQIEDQNQNSATAEGTFTSETVQEQHLVSADGQLQICQIVRGPPGLCFDSTPRELVEEYLIPKNCGGRLRFNFVLEVPVSSRHPHLLTGHFQTMGQSSWYFFTSLHQLYGKDKFRPSRRVKDDSDLARFVFDEDKLIKIRGRIFFQAGETDANKYGPKVLRKRARRTPIGLKIGWELGNGILDMTPGEMISRGAFAFRAHPGSFRASFGPFYVSGVAV